jgi:hypothetical protein
VQIIESMPESVCDHDLTNGRLDSSVGMLSMLRSYVMNRNWYCLTFASRFGSSYEILIPP